MSTSHKQLEIPIVEDGIDENHSTEPFMKDLEDCESMTHSPNKYQTSSKLTWEHYKNPRYRDDWRKIPTLRERKTYHPQNNSISVFRYTENDELHSYSFCYLSEQGSNNPNKINLKNNDYY